MSEQSVVSTNVVQLEPVTITGRKRELAFKVALEGPGGTVILQASPLLSEARSAFYDGYAITHLPTELFSYKFTSSRKFQIQGRLVSRNISESNENAKYLDLIRSWIEPDFGSTGATPPILKLYGYNNNNIDGLQVIIKSYSFGFPDDVDFIHEADIPMPVIGQLTIELDEAYSAQQITDGKWRVDISEGGFFEGGETPEEDTLLPATIGIANGRLPTSTPDAFTNPSNVASSSSLKDDVSRITQVAKNALIAGTSPAALLSSAATSVVSQIQTSTRSADGFGRSNNLPPPSLVTG